MRVYLDNGATTMVAKEVVKEMSAYFSESYGNPSSLHSFGEQAKRALDNSRKTIAKKINAQPEEIIFLSGGSESINLALMGAAHASKEKGNHIITSKIEHPAVLGTCNELQKEGFEVTYIDVDEEGILKLDDLKKAINKKTILVSIMHANNEIGTIQPIEEIGKICREKGIILHTDAVQGFCKVPIDVKKMNLDLASFSAHKIHGPKGAGALYIKKGTKIIKQIYGGHQESDLRAGTENIPGIVGFAKAANLITKKDIEKMTRLRNKFIESVLKNIPDTKLNGSREKRLCNNVNISFKHIEGEALLTKLDFEGIAVSTGSACSSRELMPSHVLMAIGLKPEIAHGSIRFTLSRYTTEKETDYVLEKLEKAVKELRAVSPFR